VVGNKFASKSHGSQRRTYQPAAVRRGATSVPHDHNEAVRRNEKLLSGATVPHSPFSLVRRAGRKLILPEDPGRAPLRIAVPILSAPARCRIELTGGECSGPPSKVPVPHPNAPRSRAKLAPSLAKPHCVVVPLVTEYASNCNAPMRSKPPTLIVSRAELRPVYTKALMAMQREF
jgi:hypothetical protein